MTHKKSQETARGGGVGQGKGERSGPYSGEDHHVLIAVGSLYSNKLRVCSGATGQRRVWGGVDHKKKGTAWGNGGGGRLKKNCNFISLQTQKGGGGGERKRELKKAPHIATKSLPKRMQVGGGKPGG